MRCTFINAYTEDACGGCGGTNKKRDRLLRDRREEAEKLSRLQTARRCRDRRVLSACFRCRRSYVGPQVQLQECNRSALHGSNSRRL